MLGEHWTHFILFRPQKRYGLDDINNYIYSIWLNHKLYSIEALNFVYDGELLVLLTKQLMNVWFLWTL